VVLATTTPDHPCPATAPQVAARLGLGTVAAYDIAAVCSGFLYALATASAQITAGQARRVLVIGAETYSTILNPADRTTSVIFGDGAGAVVLAAVPDTGRPGVIVGVDLGSDGSQQDLIMIPGGGSRERATGGEPDPLERYFTMQGRKVFAEAVTRMSGSASALLDRIGWPVESVDHLVGHQANVRILKALAERLGIAEDRAVINIDRVGNTSAASVPLALSDAAAAGTLTAGSRVLLTAFGGGLTWGAAALTWPDLNAA
jgi:3-oxoacyl-[acyl-carrier-protein] synthase-3